MTLTQNSPVLPGPSTAEGDLLPLLPDPAVQPTVDVWPTTAKALGISKQAAYDAVARGEIPHIRVGTTIRVLNAPLQRMLGIRTVGEDGGEGHGAAA